VCYNDSIIDYHDLYYPPNFCSTIGISEIKLNYQIDIYPNPANSVLMIDIIDNDAAEYSLNIYTIVGQKINSLKVISDNVTEIPIENFCKGIYFVEVISDDGKNLVRKFIKEQRVLTCAWFCTVRSKWIPKL
jgi:hypothetical protein